jgi:hypothetical protein
MAATYEPIATTTLGSSQSSVTFGSGGTISQAYTDLILVSNILWSSPATKSLAVQIGNGSVDTGTNYSYTLLNGDGSTPSSDRNSNLSFGRIGIAYGSYFNAISNFQNYSNTTTYKTILSRSNAPSGYVDSCVSLWRSTSAINVITIYVNAGANFDAGSTFTLYGIKAA